MAKKRKYAKTLIFLLVGFFLLFWFGNLFHEFVHQIAFEGDNINSKIHFVYGFPVYVMAERGCESKECVMINGINDILDYNLFIFRIIFIIAFAIIIYLLDNKLNSVPIKKGRWKEKKKILYH